MRTHYSFLACIIRQWVTASAITGLLAAYTSSVAAQGTPNTPSQDLDRNWTLERTYDGNGNVVAESKSFSDALGRPTQTQARNAATKQVFATQTVYSTGGQPVLQTLAAPINNLGFGYKSDFITAGGTPYGPANFELNNSYLPSAVDAGTQGTLGYYFSQLNAQEPLTPLTSYPFSLVEPYEGPMGGTKRAAGPGDELRMGKGREAKGRSFPLRREFDDYIRLRQQFVPSSPQVSLEYQGMKSVSINADGRESIVVTNKEGQAIISCLSGPQYPALAVFGFISSEATNPYDANAPAYQDIHIPAAGPQDVKFTMGSYATNGGKIRIINLLTNQVTDYTIAPPASPGAEPELHVTLDPGFYRFVSVEGTQWSAYDAHYGNFSYTYYDDAGRVIATVAPNGLPGGGNYVRNPGFEQDGTGSTVISSWQSSGTPLSFTGQGSNSIPRNSGFYCSHWGGSAGHDTYTYQVVSLPNGTYTARAWVKNTGGNSVAQFTAENYGAGPSTVAIPVTYDWGSWQQIQIKGIVVSNGQCQLTFHSASTTDKWIIFDDVELVREANGSAPTFVTRNVYDTSGRLLSTESNDEGRSEYVYAKDGRIRFSQSALQRPSGRYSYSNYDEVGRVVESGEYTPGSYATNVFENHLTATPVSNSVLQPGILENRTRTSNLFPAWCAQRNQVWYDLPFDGTSGSQGNDSQLNGRQQAFTIGAVTKTQNDNVTSWYSYDNLGRVTWVVQDIVGVGVKTLDYKYDFSGNVLEVAYQKTQADAFFHYYTYDDAQRLTKVETSPDGVARTTQAEYSYYLHGPLKRVQVAGNLQGVDYTYTLQGALKAINHVNPTLEPGHDSPQRNGVQKDLFALTLDYFSGDYQSRDLPGAPPVVGGTSVPTRYDGAIQGAAWRTAASTDIHRVAYTYDEKSQLQNAQYGQWQRQANNGSYLLNSASTSALREGGLTYDANGNIQSLLRTNEKGLTADNFSYTYKPNTNQLSEVHTGSPSGATVLDYEYDALGQMTRQRDEQGQRYFTYDVTGKTTGVYLDAARQQPVVTFAYDDRGFRVSKTAYVNGVAKTTYYVRDVAGNVLAVYDKPTATSAIQRTEVPLYGASRVGTLTRLDDGSQDYRYELNDHLGDARVVFHKPTTTTDTETMELSGVSTQAAFQNDNLYRASGGYGSSSYAARLTDSQPAGQELKRVLTVAKGDTITFSAWGKMPGQIAPGPGPAEARVLPYVLLGAAAMPAELPQTSSENERHTAGSGPWLGRLAAGLGITLRTARQAQTQAPQIQALQGWIKYRVLDDQGQEVSNQLTYLTGATSNWERLQLGVRVAQGGTVEVIAGSSGNGAAVYFDDLKVEQTGGLIVQEQHQYAFGAPLPGLSYTVGNMRYRHGYQGQYAEKDAETEYESFQARIYNPRLGRWTSVDPVKKLKSGYIGLGNNPVLFSDADGRDIFILNANVLGGGQVSIQDALKVFYKTPEGKAALDEYINNPHRNLYLSFTIPGPNSTVQGITFNTDTPAGFVFNMNAKYLNAHVHNDDERALFTPFNGLKMQNAAEKSTFVALATSESYTLYDLSILIAHELLAHATKGQDVFGRGEAGHTDPKIWGTPNLINASVPNSVARSVSAGIKVFLLLKDSAIILKAMKNIGKIINPPLLPKYR